MARTKNPTWLYVKGHALICLGSAYPHWGCKCGAFYNEVKRRDAHPEHVRHLATVRQEVYRQAPEPDPILTADRLRYVLMRLIVGDGCWEWMGRGRTLGYALGWVPGRSRLVHRFIKEHFIGRLLLQRVEDCDHLCRNRACVNPDHLEIVTHQENVARGLNGRLKTHCLHGHPYSGDNLGRTGQGYRYCITCRRVNQERQKSRRREGAAAEVVIALRQAAQLKGTK